MFERYAEAARRALFFARYEVDQLGALEIGTEHLLLGLMRDATGLLRDEKCVAATILNSYGLRLATPCT